MSDTPYHLRPSAPQRRVVCAALKAQGSLVIGPRHYDHTMHEQIDVRVYSGEDRSWWRVADQGFVDQWGTFMTREEAWAVATAARQVLYGPHLPGGQLDSSDLY